MKTFLVFVFIYALPIQSQWVQVSTVPTTQLNAVKFFDAYTGITCGVGGIWRSTNSGINWTQVLSNVNINSQSFPNNTTGYAVADSGKIFKTTNGGINWSQIGIGLTTKNLNTVAFPSANSGWVMGQSGKILYTFNGGTSFSTQSNGDTTYDINYLHMVNGSTGYYCGSSNANAETFGGTGNGGFNWLYTFYMAGNVLNASTNIPTQTGYVVAVGTNGRIRRTTTNGTTWTLITSPVNVHLNHIVFLDASTGYIAGNSGNILKTTNSGFNWIVEATVTGNNIRYLSFINANTAWAVGNNGMVVRIGIPVGVNSEGEIVKKYTLNQNYPNPFNPITTIEFQISKKDFINIKVFDLLGNEIETLVNSEMNIGNYVIHFNAERYASGIYVYRLCTNNEIIDSKKMIVIK